jgi:hypothetical protein
MMPVEARAWIAGINLRQLGDTAADQWAAWHRFMVESVPPPWKEERAKRIPELYDRSRSGRPVPLWYAAHEWSGAADDLHQLSDEEES